ncbi:hypothetical protein FACS189451_12220 [Bacteroidia bacterium]|nr:hypothetical protein FACS189451_12220 [Bacteroidia bacterium]
MAQEFLFGLSQLKFAVTGTPVEIGYIEEGSFDLGGQAGETIEINAAQVKGSPVLVLPKKNGTIKPNFDLIQINYAKLATLMGGTATADGWNAPSDLAQVKGHAEIYTDSGHLIDIPACTLVAYPNDKLSLDGVAKIHCEITPVQSAPGVAPYSISDIPDEG